MRTADGFCIECDPDEPGEVIGKILRDASKPAARFEGYATQAETDKKILRDVFEKGDVWFRTGDLMRKDARGYFYFVDRIGDTFRWKGENVSTTEVAEAMGTFEGVQDANVYGVSVPGRDGRAGMAAIVVADNVNLTALRDHLAAAAARLCAAGVPAHPPGHGHDRDLQAEEGRPGEAGLRSGRDRRADLLQRSRRQGVRADRRRRSTSGSAAGEVRL